MKTKEIVYIGLLSALICVLSPIAIPISGGVPISLATFAVMFASVIFGKKIGTISTIIYIIIGAIGLPVFSNYYAGIGVILGMTGGYIIGYIPLAYISGWFAEKFRDVEGYKQYIYYMLGMILGTAVLYTVGTIWFEYLMQLPLWSALMACVIPFIPGDLLKMILVCVIYTRVKHTKFIRN